MITEKIKISWCGGLGALRITSIWSFFFFFSFLFGRSKSTGGLWNCQKENVVVVVVGGGGTAADSFKLGLQVLTLESVGVADECVSLIWAIRESRCSQKKKTVASYCLRNVRERSGGRLIAQSFPKWAITRHIYRQVKKQKQERKMLNKDVRREKPSLIRLFLATTCAYPRVCFLVLWNSFWPFTSRDRTVWKLLNNLKIFLSGHFRAL